MVNLLPAVLVGGPPHAGKSVLLYNLTHALGELGVPHHAIRACPDGEGNWYQEGKPETMSEIRVSLKGAWPVSFVQHFTFSLEHRCLPFLVDMGGIPRAGELPLFRQCTHAVLLVKQEEPQATQHWRTMVQEANLTLLAQLNSQLRGTSMINSSAVPLDGSITGLERQSVKVREDPVFQALVERIAALFNDFSLQDLEHEYLKQAPSVSPLNLQEAVRVYTSSPRWEVEMLLPFLESLSKHAKLSVYGKAPSWLYAALSAHTIPQPFYLFDPKLPFGWVLPAKVQLGTAVSPVMQIKVQPYDEVTILTITFPNDRIEYFQTEPLEFPTIAVNTGVIFDGRIPNWLLTALVRLYQGMNVPWLACYQPPLGGAVVVASQTPLHPIGEIVSMPSRDR